MAATFSPSFKCSSSHSQPTASGTMYVITSHFSPLGFLKSQIPSSEGGSCWLSPDTFPTKLSVKLGKRKAVKRRSTRPILMMSLACRKPKRFFIWETVFPNFRLFFLSYSSHFSNAFRIGRALRRANPGNARLMCRGKAHVKPPRTKMLAMSGHVDTNHSFLS